MAAHTSTEVIAAMSEARVPAGPILSTADIYAEPQYQQRGMFHVTQPPSGALLLVFYMELMDIDGEPQCQQQGMFHVTNATLRCIIGANSESEKGKEGEGRLSEGGAVCGEGCSSCGSVSSHAHELHGGWHLQAGRPPSGAAERKGRQKQSKNAAGLPWLRTLLRCPRQPAIPQKWPRLLVSTLMEYSLSCRWPGGHRSRHPSRHARHAWRHPVGGP